MQFSSSFLSFLPSLWENFDIQLHYNVHYEGMERVILLFSFVNFRFQIINNFKKSKYLMFKDKLNKQLAKTLLDDTSICSMRNVIKSSISLAILVST